MRGRVKGVIHILGYGMMRESQRHEARWCLKNKWCQDTENPFESIQRTSLTIEFIDMVVGTVIILRVTVHSTRQYTTIARTKQREVQRVLEEERLRLTSTPAGPLACSSSHREKVSRRVCVSGYEPNAFESKQRVS